MIKHRNNKWLVSWNMYDEYVYSVETSVGLIFVQNDIEREIIVYDMEQYLSVQEQLIAEKRGYLK